MNDNQLTFHQLLSVTLILYWDKNKMILNLGEKKEEGQ